jgi:DNA replication initiation complex subunit (GINS family)
MVKLKDEQIKVPTLQKALWQETEDSALQPLPPDFFQQVRKSIERLSLLKEKEPNDVRLAAQTRMEHLFRDLITNRLLKLMKLSLREERLRVTKKKMTGEERWLFDRLVELIRNWETQVLEIGLGG